MEEHGQPVTNRRLASQSRLSKWGVRGVCRARKATRRDGRVWWHVVYRVVWFPEPGPRRVRDFYVRGGDEQAALERAAAFRREREREMAARDPECAGGEELARRVAERVPRGLPPELTRVLS